MPLQGPFLHGSWNWTERYNINVSVLTLIACCNGEICDLY
jgi:hypothetical protein